MGLQENFQISSLSDEHALFSPSQPAWLNYDDDEYIRKLIAKFRSNLGTEIHEWCSIQIMLSHKQASLREIYRDIETHIFEKNSYKDSKTGETVINKYGQTLLFFMKYIPEDTFRTVKSYVNDCVVFNMDSEVKLSFSDIFFGTADAVKLDKNVLRIFDLKTGSTPAKIEQLLIYASLYLLKYNIRPEQVYVELRIYQNNDVLYAEPKASDLVPIMNKIIHFDKVTKEFTKEFTRGSNQ